MLKASIASKSSWLGCFSKQLCKKLRQIQSQVREHYPKIPSAALSSTRSCWSVWIIIKTKPAAPFCLIDRGSAAR